MHVSHVGPQQGDVKIIILLFSSEKKAYVGFIPVDQVSFVNKIKNVIQSARKGQVNVCHFFYNYDFQNHSFPL